MTSKERVIAAINRQPTDRVPVFMWFHPDTARILARELRIPPARLGQVMGNDIIQTWVSNNYAMEGIVHERDGEGHTDEWGIEWVKDGPFNQIVKPPLAEAEADAILAYKFPEKHYPALVSRMDAVVAERGDLFVGCDFSPCVFEMYCRLRGMEMALYDVAGEPRLAETMMARCADESAALGEMACRKYKLDWFWTGDDVGGQYGMMMGPETWRRLVKPHLARVADVGKRHGLPVAYHSCGAIRPIIPDLIEIGITILNPIQCNCPGMSPADLKRDFGRELTFMGGVDTQDLLPNASATEVRRATERLLATMTSDGGGYILAASHTIPPETPLENIFAMYEVAGISREGIEDRAAGARKIEDRE
jgi:uroporphyrinogen decarboxylase